MEEHMTYPYDDDYMIFDKLTGRYMLTEQAFLDYGFDIRSQIIDGGYTSPEQIIKGFFRTVTNLVYGYIHGFSANNMAQDRLIAKLPSMRNIIMQAMLAQAAYVYANGNLLLSTKPEERDRYIDGVCMDYLNQTVPEIGTTILYAGC